MSPIRIFQWKTYLNSEKDVEIDQSSRQHHTLLKVDIVIGSAVYQEVVFPVELDSFGTQI